MKCSVPELGGSASARHCASELCIYKLVTEVPSVKTGQFHPTHSWGCLAGVKSPPGPSHPGQCLPCGFPTSIPTCRVSPGPPVPHRKSPCSSPAQVAPGSQGLSGPEATRSRLGPQGRGPEALPCTSKLAQPPPDLRLGTSSFLETLGPLWGLRQRQQGPWGWLHRNPADPGRYLWVPWLHPHPGNRGAHTSDCAELGTKVTMPGLVWETTGTVLPCMASLCLR